jgi:hypothetical protein
MFSPEFSQFTGKPHVEQVVSAVSQEMRDAVAQKKPEARTFAMMLDYLLRNPGKAQKLEEKR